MYDVYLGACVFVCNNNNNNSRLLISQITVTVLEVTSLIIIATDLVNNNLETNQPQLQLNAKNTTCGSDNRDEVRARKVGGGGLNPRNFAT